MVEEYVLSTSDQWKLRRTNVSIAPTRNVFAPANLRAASGNKVRSAGEAAGGAWSMGSGNWSWLARLDAVGGWPAREGVAW